MLMQFVPALTLLAVVGTGLMAGLFFIFSNTIMASLARLPAGQGMTAMNVINTVIQNPLFLALFMGTALIALILAGIAIFTPGMPRLYLLLGAGLYLVGVFAVTVAVNVPLNDALGAADPMSAEGAALWATYLDRWVFWNHVRTVANTGSLIAFAMAMR